MSEAPTHGSSLCVPWGYAGEQKGEFPGCGELLRRVLYAQRLGLNRRQNVLARHPEKAHSGASFQLASRAKPDRPMTSKMLAPPFQLAGGLSLRKLEACVTVLTLAAGPVARGSFGCREYVRRDGT